MQFKKLWRAVGMMPITVGIFAGVSWWLAANGIQYSDVFTVNLFNPFLYLTGAVFHEGWAHFMGNLRLLLLFGIPFTWLTGNRHTFALIMFADVLAQFISTAIGQPAVGLSGTVFALAAALLVRSIGVAMQRASVETVQVAIGALFGPIAVMFLIIAILAGNSYIAHFSHFFSLLFGGAFEAMYVLSEAQEDEDGDHENGSGGLPGRPY